jgi:hypothetical protein
MWEALFKVQMTDAVLPRLALLNQRRVEITVLIMERLLMGPKATRLPLEGQEALTFMMLQCGPVLSW